MTRKGFTLIEILLVVAAIAILAGIVILAINPTKQLAQTRDAERSSDIKTILDAVYQYSIDHSGVWPIEIPESQTEICKTTANLSPVLSLNGSHLMAQVITQNGNSTLTVRTSCLNNEVLASQGDVQPVKNQLCNQTGAWNIMELSNGKKLSGSGYGCQVENQLRNEGFGHKVCKAENVLVVAPEPDPEPEILLPQNENENLVANLDQNEEEANCVDLSFLTEDELYLTDLPEDPSNESASGVGYFISMSENGRITVTAPLAEQTEALSVTR